MNDAYLYTYVLKAKIIDNDKWCGDYCNTHTQIPHTLIMHKFM